jgi:two-component system KDP operon response regulator KdpE
MRPKVLVVEDAPEQARMLNALLASRGYDVRNVKDPEAALSTLPDWGPELVVADLESPLGDRLELCRRVRETSEVPLIVLSASSDAQSEVAALDAGADDYITKPFRTDNLLARVRAALRRSTGGPETPALGVGAFHIDFHERRVRVHGQPVRLTPKELDLFVFMARHPNRVLPHKTLLGAVWGEASEEQSEYLRVFVGQLRKKFETDRSKPRYLVTEPWVGYRFNPTGMVQ